jgi:N-acetyl-gamma-glutamyl-phosphate/LysW-gamma-L-alpha-aminoadipyl-6-phosphate reductase
MAVHATIIGGSGYGGGELLRLLLGHPQVEIAQITSRRLTGKFVHSVHPNLRAATRLQFSSPDDVQPCDWLFLALPHGEAVAQIDRWAALAPRIVDLSADFRIRSAERYAAWYDSPHPRPEWLERFVYGLPEFHRTELATAHYASGVGCNATAVNLALHPLAQARCIESVVVEVKVGSSEGGAESTPATHHPERSGAVRTFAATGHRHQAEVQQELGDFPLHFSATAIELVRGVHATCHVFLNQPLDERDVWKLYRQAYAQEPFIRIVNERQGIHRLPEPKWVCGANYCDIGFQKDAHSNRLVVISALDNLMKGAAGSAVQCMNVMLGWPERMGLEFLGLHPY